MLQHILLITFRNFRRFKTTFFINLIGLSSGLACVFMIYLWVNDELHVDRFHSTDEQLVQVMANEESPAGIRTLDGTSGALGDVLEKEIPEVEYSTVITPPFWFQKFTVSHEATHINAKGLFAGKDYFNVFSYDLVQGNKDQVLAGKNSIVISESLARQLFNTTENVVGKTLEWKWFDYKEPCIISGICKDIPVNSTYQFDFLLSFEAWKDIVPASADLGASGPFHTFLVLRKGTDMNAFNSKLADFSKKKFETAAVNLFVRNFGDGYLYGEYENGVQAGGRIEYVRLFSIIGFCILIIACMNFINLSTAKASQRIKEVGVKKVSGADRKTLVMQYMSEAMIISFLSLIFAFAAVQLFLPQFNAITGKQLYLSFNTDLIITTLVITLLVGLLAGSYPAFYLTGFNPAVVLKGKFRSSSGELWTRKGLVVFQFTLAIIFIVAVLVVYKQTEFIQTRHLGYSKDNVVYFDAEGKAVTSRETFITELKQIPGVVHASTMMGNIIVPSFRSVGGIQWDGKNQDDKITFAPFIVNYGLLETLGMEVTKGRFFSADAGTDHASVVLNETAIQVMEIEEPIGKVIQLQGRDVTIIGVVRDFNFQSLYETVKPVFFRLSPEETMTTMVKLETGKEAETLKALQKFYSTFNPGFVLEYKFLDQDFQAQYAAEKRVAVLAKYFAGLAILISCLGLFGLAAYTTERRIKEIGIRKVLGSSASGITWLLTKDFSRSVMISVLIALPISYVLVTTWLNTFAYKISLDAGYFVLAGGLTLIVAWITVSSQALRGARVNPTRCLRNE